MIFSGMTSSNTAEYKFYLKSGVIKFQFIIIIIWDKQILALIYTGALSKDLQLSKVTLHYTLNHSSII